jgi:hypothetical protein
MKNLKEELARILADDETVVADSFAKFVTANADSLPLPGVDSQFDKAMWSASEHLPLSAKDESILKRVTTKLLGEGTDVVAATVLKLKDLIGTSREATINTWQDMLAGMAWQQMVPAGALRGVGTQMVSLGTFQQQLEDANVQINLGWLVDKEHLRILLQAKDTQDEALCDVELRIREVDRGVVFSRKTNEDGAIVAPNVHVGPGQYRIEVIHNNKVAETPDFIV